MASPPFNINQATPGDSDIVSQYPPNERALRDIIESWIEVNHDVVGNHYRIDMPRVVSPTTPLALIDVLFVSLTGRLKIKHTDGTEEYVGTPPGQIGYFASAPLLASIPVGWLYAGGQAVSRTTYPDLFAAIGSTFGDGDHSTTFNVPDLKGRAAIGIDDGTLRISTTTMSTVTVGGVGGIETNLLLSTNVPSLSVSSVTGSVTVSSVSVNVSGSITGSSTGSTASGSVSGTASGGAVTGTATGTVTGTAAVTSTTANTATGFIQSANVTGGADKAFTSSGKNEAIASAGTITGSISSTALAGTLSSPATVTGTFSGATVSTGAVSGSFTGSGSGTGSGSFAGSGVTANGTIPVSNMQPSIVLFPLIKY